jgi:hypothetical protein
MARYNVILAGPADKVKPQVREAICAAAVLPGTVVVASGLNFAQAGANATARAYLVQDNYLALKDVDTAWPAGDRVVGLNLQDDELYNVRVPTGQNIAHDAPLTTNAAGKLVLATTGQRILFFAAEAYNNTSGADQLVRARTANTNLPAA